MRLNDTSNAIGCTSKEVCVCVCVCVCVECWRAAGAGALKAPDVYRMLDRMHSIHICCTHTCSSHSIFAHLHHTLTPRSIFWRECLLGACVMCVHVCLCAHAHVCVYMCVYVGVNACAHTHTHTHTHALSLSRTHTDCVRVLLHALFLEGGAGVRMTWIC